jgi:predicted PurR-regulated permease PerM
MKQGSLIGDIGRTLGGYAAGQAKVSAVLACLYSIGYALSEVPFWLLLGVICGALNVVPVVGSVIGVLLTAFVVFLGNGGTWNYIGVLITFVIAQALEGFWLSPRLLGRSVGLSAWYVFFGVLIGGAMFGPLGILLAVPVLAVLAVLWRHAAKRRASV